jgi:hypothetical protein
LGYSIDTVKKITETLIDASKEVGLEANAEKTKYMLMFRHQNAGQNRKIKIDNRLFENVAQYKYLGTRVTDQNLIQEKIKTRLISGNACYHSVQNLLFSRLPSKNVKIRICKTVILIWVFENMVLRRIFGPKRDEVIGGWRKLHNEKLHNFYGSKSIIRMIKSRRMRCAGYVARMGRRGMHTGFWLESQKERDH